MKNKSVIIIILSTFLSIRGFTQSILSDLIVNPQIIKNKENKNIQKNKKTNYLTIPFIEDFSRNEGVFPNSAIFSDKFTYVNRNMAMESPTIGVVTFDALDSEGKIYPHASIYPFSADTLTSNPIRLDSIFGENPRELYIDDTVYFSFYYQPQGIGKAPEPKDSLILEFYSPNYGEWRRVWGVGGTTLANFYAANNSKSYFKLQSIVIDDENYITKDFRFRFRNYASISNIDPAWASNDDYWNIDYIYIDINENRHHKDVYFNDIAIGKEPSSIFNYNYTAMPIDQFNANPMNAISSDKKIYNYLSNLTDTVKNCNYGYAIFDNFGDIAPGNGSAYNFNSGNNELNIKNFSEIRYYKDISDFVYQFPTLDEYNTRFYMKHILLSGLGSEEINEKNDTLIVPIIFSNYFAYDDGSPENGYGFTSSNSTFAITFKLQQADSLRGVQLFFNQTKDNASESMFKIKVWSKLFPIETVLVEKIISKQEFTDSLNEYCTYIFDNPIAVEESFHIGIEQLSDKSLNIGFDKNNDNSKVIYENYNGSWTNTPFKGSIMLRPIVSKKTLIGIEENDKYNNVFNIYPNPSNNIININSEINNLNDWKYFITDIAGKQIISNKVENTIDVSNLKSGIYFIYFVNTKSNQRFTEKISIIH